ncbi:hypothetical protein PSTT_04066 [Puccinia striiformis]|uniref:Uncharacterized protein n=1 Tax=Puccinia striiformis TaxID=27350 RepID=A0A2S4VU81_9BASI|nr:hypothetical protein PSTT_04066 [Puccinia striiformis]
MSKHHSEMEEHRNNHGEFPTHLEIRPVYWGFIRLASKCNTTEDIHHLQSNTCDVDVKRVSLREGKMALAKLQSNLLPLLQQQLTTLLGVLDPWGLMTSQANSILQLILEMQAALEHNLDQIKVALNTLCPEESQDKSSSSGDQHNKHLKLFKLNCLDSMLTEQLFKYMQANFQEAFVLLEQVALCTGLTTNPLNIYCQGMMGPVCKILPYFVRGNTPWINRSELDNCKQQWRGPFEDIVQHLSDFTKWANILMINREQDNSPTHHG